LRSKKRFAPLLDAPISAWMVFPAVFAALFASHFTLLGLPYYWDEAGYYIPAAWDFFRTGSLIPITTLTNAHPPLPSIYLALWWKVFSFCPLVTRVAVLAAASFGLTAVWRLAMRLTGFPAVAFWTVALTALYPIWFAQSTLAHADIFAAACTLWGLVYVLPGALPGPDRRPGQNQEPGQSWKPGQSQAALRKPWAAALWFALAVLSKETAIAIPLTLAAVSLIESLRAPRLARLRLVREAAWLASCALPLAAWYAYHYSKTGFLFGNPEFLRYNAQANLEPLRILAAFGYRVLHLTAQMNLFVPVGMAIAALLFNPRPVLAGAGADGPAADGSGDSDADGRTANDSDASDRNADSSGADRPEGGKPEGGKPGRPAIAPAALRRILLLLLANAVLFSVLGGALLTRYLLPMYPLVLLLAVSTLYRRARFWQALAALSAAAFFVGLFVNPPYRFAPEDNLAYARVIRLHQAGIRQLERLYPGATVLSAWPVTDELTRPELGYLKQPYEVYRLEDFTPAQIARAAEEPEKYSAALVFSTKYDPPSLSLNLGHWSFGPPSFGPWNEAVDERYFGLHHDLPPEEIALELHGDLVWKRQDHGQWIALIRFNRQFEARLEDFHFCATQKPCG
jgi:4-amino-4-deoxy-L-arabinose transferase-like glycosyltransferase